MPVLGWVIWLALGLLVARYACPNRRGETFQTLLADVTIHNECMERRLGLLLSLVALLMACSGGTAGDLADAEDRWEASGVSDYQLKVRLTCFCPPEVAGPFDVTVIDEEIVEVSYEGDQIEPTGEAQTMAFTVEGLFGIVKDNVAADALTVTYDDELGYPTLIDIEEDFDAVDDEWTVSAEVIPSGG